jgi:hypothetical protein
MPSHHPHSHLHSFAKGVKKPQFTSPPSSYKNFFHVFQKKNHGPGPSSGLGPAHHSTSIFSGFLPQWFATPSIMVPMSNVFESSDCIWYHGTVYVKEAVAAVRMQQCQCQVAQPVVEPVAQPEPEPTQLVVEPEPVVEPVHSYDDDDDDTESVCSNGSHNSSSHNSSSHNSNNSNNLKPGRNIGKQNQLKYLKDGMLLRHMVLSDKWFATFDSETNRIIRTSDGVAFDTLRQFARLHCNEVDSSFTTANVWSDPHFQYHIADGQWHPLSNLKKK